MSYFSIAAPQTVILPNGTKLDFRINPVDSSLVEIHLRGLTLDGAQGTYVIPMKRNGSAAGAPEFIHTEQPKAPPKQELTETDPSVRDPSANPLAGYKSVDDDAVRSPEPPKPTASPLVTSDLKRVDEGL